MNEAPRLDRLRFARSSPEADYGRCLQTSACLSSCSPCRG